MKLEEMSVKDLAALVDVARMFTGAGPQVESPSSYKIVVLDRGFVYVGDVSWSGDNCIIRNGANIRRWGTTQGLGELAIRGPQTNTALDPVMTVCAPRRAVIHTLDTDASLWANKY